jgi:RNA polymerase sigma factor (sigma-70 family)
MDIFKLLQGCLHNDRKSQKGLYQLLRSHAFSICYRYLDSQELIEELLNKSFIQLFKHIDQFKKEKYPDINSGVKVWLTRMVVIRCIDHYRQMQLFPPEPVPTPEVKLLSDPPENAGETPSGQEIIESIRKLPPVFRIIFNLNVIEGMAHKEIGDHLHISASRSASILVSAREMIRISLLKKTPGTWAGEESSLSCSSPV